MNVKQETNTSAIRAAGGLILQTKDGVVSTVLIHRPKYDDWSIPKGKVDPGETLQQTALREVREETFLECTLGAPLTTQHYPAQNKTVHYWVMHVVADHGFVPNVEVDQLRWVPLDRAAGLLDYAQDKSLIDEAQEFSGGLADNQRVRRS